MSDFDLNALIAERERLITPRSAWTFDFGPDVYELPGEADVVALLMLSDEETASAGFARLLGSDQWARMQAEPTVMGPDEFGALIQAYTAAIGANPGESGASSSS